MSILGHNVSNSFVRLRINLQKQGVDTMAIWQMNIQFCINPSITYLCFFGHLSFVHINIACRSNTGILKRVITGMCLTLCPLLQPGMVNTYLAYCWPIWRILHRIFRTIKIRLHHTILGTWLSFSSCVLRGTPNPLKRCSTISATTSLIFSSEFFVLSLRWALRAHTPTAGLCLMKCSLMRDAGRVSWCWLLGGLLGGLTDAECWEDSLVWGGNVRGPNGLVRAFGASPPVPLQKSKRIYRKMRASRILHHTHRVGRLAKTNNITQ